MVHWVEERSLFLWCPGDSCPTPPVRAPPAQPTDHPETQQTKTKLIRAVKSWYMSLSSYWHKQQRQKDGVFIRSDAARIPVILAIISGSLAEFQSPTQCVRTRRRLIRVTQWDKGPVEQSNKQLWLCPVQMFLRHHYSDRAAVIRWLTWNWEKEPATY